MKQVWVGFMSVKALAFTVRAYHTHLFFMLLVMLLSVFFFVFVFVDHEINPPR